MSTFKDQVIRVVQAIPRGSTMTYQAVAARAGNPRAARAVGSIMRSCYKYDYGDTIPCHRVIRSDGTIGGYEGGGGEEKRRKLLAEGVELSV